MKTSHTPGPWRADRNAEGDWEIHAATEHSEFSFWIATVHAETPKEQTEANARLIAVAPELLDILKEIIIQEVDSAKHGIYGITSSLVDQAQEAIAKATQP